MPDLRPDGLDAAVIPASTGCRGIRAIVTAAELAGADRIRNRADQAYLKMLDDA